MTSAATPSTPDSSAAARTRALIKNTVGTLRSKFPLSPRTKQALKLATIPFLMTTALTADVMHQPEVPTVVWSHGNYSSAFNNVPGLYSGSGAIANPNDPVPPPPMRCYRAQRDERHPLLTLNSQAWRGFYEMNKSGPYSRALHQSAIDLQLSICETSDPTLVRNYDALNRLAGISKNGELPTTIREAAHGIVHALMRQNNLSTPAANEALFSRLNRHLTGEAVAVTAEYVVAIEMYNSGDNSLLRALQAENHPALRYFVQAYNDALQRHPRDGRKAIDEAAGGTITFLLRQREFVEANSDIVLRSYLAELGSDGVRPRSSSNFDSDDMRDMGKVGSRSFSGEAQLLSAQELATISPDITRMVEAMETMHAQRNHYRAPQRVIADNPYLNINGIMLQTQITNSGGLYTMRQAFERARYARDYRYSGRDWQMTQTFRYGMQADYTKQQTPLATLPMWENLNRLRTLSPTIGTRVLDYATRANVTICYGSLSPYLLGQWQPDNGIIVMADRTRNNPAGSTQIVAHELLHLMQNAAGIGSFTNRFNIYDMQMGSLTREAAASTISALVALEFKLNGDDTLWQDVGEPAVATRMLQVYNESRATGADHNTSLEAAGLEGFQLMFQRQWWQNSYNEGVAKDMVERIASGWYKAPGNDRYPLSRMQLAGQVSDTFNFTRNLTAAPTDEMRFGNNDDMRNLFAYLNLQQLRRNLGDNNEAVIAARNLLRENKNPYADINFDDLVGMHNADQGRPIVQIANILIGREPRPQNMPRPLATPAASAPVPTCGA